MTKIGRNQPCPCGSGRKYKRCCGQRDSAAHMPAVPAQAPGGYRWVETDLDRFSSSVARLVGEGRLDEADAACEELRTRYPEVVERLMCKATVFEARGETELAIECFERTLAWIGADPENFGPESRESFCEEIERLRGSLGGTR